MTRAPAFAAILFALLFSTTSEARQAKPPRVRSPRLYVIDCGKLAIEDWERFRLKKEEMAATDMSAPCFLVVHPKGTLMWDSGPVPDATFKPGSTSAMERYATSTKPLATSLAEIGYKPSDITYLALSHFHWDHVANADAFAGSTWLVRKIERDAMFPPSDVKSSERTAPQFYQKLRNSKTTYISTDDYDVFGDGTVVIKFTPGHTPGHSSLFVKLAKTGPVLVSGDLYHYPEERSLHRVPNFEVDEAQTARSRAAMEDFLAKTHAQLWIQHDLTGYGKLKKSPAYYE